MTDIGSIRAFITADTTDFDEGIEKSARKSESFEKRVTKNLDAVGNKMSSLGRSLTVAVTAPLAAMSVGFVKLASDAEETQNKFNVVFSSISGDATKASNDIAQSFGMAQDESQKLLADTGDLLTGFGFTQQAALDMSTEVNTLAADLASFTNIEGGAARASAALTKALLGERESVKSLGISILEVDVLARVLENQQKGLTFETERQAKAFATLQLAQEQSKNAIGDFARSSNSFANQMRIATAETRDMAVAFGKELLPLGLMALKWARDISDSFGELSPQTQRMAIAIGAVAAAAGPLLFIGGKIVLMFSSLIGAIVPVISFIGTGLVAAFGALTSPILLAVAGIGLVIAATSDLVDWVGLVGDAWDWVVGKFRAVADFFGDFGKFLADENANIADSSRTAIEIIAKAWLGLKIAWQVVKQSFLSVVQVVTAGLERLVSGFAEVADFVGADELANGAKKAALAMQDIVFGLEDVKDESTETIKTLMSQWDNAPAILRNDVNRLVDTFKAIPEGIANHIQSAFPGAWAAYQTLVANMQAFIDSGAVPGLTIPITMGDAASLAKAEEVRRLKDAMATGPFLTDDTAFELTSEEAFKLALIKQSVQDALTPDAAKIAAAWKGVAGTYANAFAQISGLYKKGSAEQKAFAITSIIIDTAIGIMKAMELPFPLNWAQAAAVGALGVVQLSAVGGGGGGGGAGVVPGAGDFSNQAQVAPGAQQSQVIGAPESDLDATGDIPVIKLVLDGDDAAVVVTRAALRGAGDGVNTLATVGA